MSLPNKDPAQMSDEELDKAISGEDLDNEQEDDEEELELDESKKKEKEPDASDEDEDEGDDEGEDSEDDEEEEPEEPPRKKSRREELRIQQLLSKMKEQGTPKKAEPPKGSLDYEEELDADDDTVSRLKQDREQYGQQLYSQGLEQAKSIRFHTRLEVDAPRMESKYPQLSKDSEEFNPALASAVNQMYLSTVGYDPNSDTVANDGLRYSDFVESIFELGNEIGSQKTEQTRTNIKKQAARSGLRPDGSGAAKLNLNKAPQDMTDEELDAVISQAIPSK